MVMMMAANCRIHFHLDIVWVVGHSIGLFFVDLEAIVVYWQRLLDLSSYSPYRIPIRPTLLADFYSCPL